MRYRLEINGVDFSSWIEEDGITQSPIERVKRSIVTMDGTEYRTIIEKQKLDVKLLDMPDSELEQVIAAIALHYPALVTYTSKNGQTYSSVPFYATTPTAKVKKVYGSLTYLGDISFSLEEK